MNAQDFDFVRQLFQQRTGIPLDNTKEYLVESRLDALVHRHKLGSLANLVTQMRNQPFDGLCQQAVEVLLTTETSFFRDLHPFETLRNWMLPELLKRRSAERALTIWSAACSSGQEPYSIAMLLRTHFPMLAGWNIKILASDVSAEMVARARQGRYNQIEINRGLPAVHLVNYFHKDGSEWQVKEEIRRTIEFRQINLVGAWPLLPQMDIIFLRNVMIYFDVETKKAVLKKAAQTLRSDGYLVLGGAETTFSLNDSFQRMNFSDRDSCYQLVG